MRIELKVPEAGESITEVEIGGWLKRQGEPVHKDEPVVVLESEKATMELPAPESGTLVQVLKQKGEQAKGEAEEEHKPQANTPEEATRRMPGAEARSTRRRPGLILGPPRWRMAREVLRRHGRSCAGYLSANL